MPAQGVSFAVFRRRVPEPREDDASDRDRRGRPARRPVATPRSPSDADRRSPPTPASRTRTRSGVTPTSWSATSTRSPRPRSNVRIADGRPVDRHPADKDATDLELALDAAQRARRDRGHRDRRRRRPARPLHRQPAPARAPGLVGLDARRARRSAPASPSSATARELRRGRVDRHACSPSAASATGRHHHRAALGPHRRRARTRIDPRRQQRDGQLARDRLRVRAASCSPSNPPEGPSDATRPLAPASSLVTRDRCRRRRAAPERRDAARRSRS